MVNSKKLLSLFLAVVMVFSVLTVMASAYTIGPEVSGDINYKYTVEKVDTVPGKDDESTFDYTADNIYAVTVWMQSNSPVQYITAPFHFNTELFSPIMLFDGEVTYPHGAGWSIDDYYAEMGEAAVYAFTEGDYMNNTGMYKADGSKATTKAQAKCIGLGNKNSAGTGAIVELVAAGHPLYEKWNAGLPENTGVMYVNIDIASNTKTAYLNTIEGITTSTDWNRMFTVYFEAIADDVSGAEFGVFTDNCFTVDGDVDASGYGYFVDPQTAKYGSNPNKNVVSNAVIEAAAKNPIYRVKNQIQWADKENGLVNLGVVAGFNTEDIKSEFNANGTSTTIDKVGAIVKIGDSEERTEYQRFVYNATHDGKPAYYFRAVVTNIPKDYDGDIVVTPLVLMMGETTPIYGEAVTIKAADLERYVGKLPA